MSVAIIGLVVGFVLQASAVGYWGGRLYQAVQSIQDEIPSLRSAKHDHANHIQGLLGRMEDVEERMDEARSSRKEIFDRMEATSERVTRLEGRVDALAEKR